MHNLGVEGGQLSVWAGGCGLDPLPGRETSEDGPRERDLGKQNLKGGEGAEMRPFMLLVLPTRISMSMITGQL